MTSYLYTSRVLFSLALLALFPVAAFSQGLYVPQVSPRAALEQTIGVCNLRVEYSRPSVKGREIFGGLVPYDKVWRAGANAATVIEFDQVINFAGTLVKPGKYALMMIPTTEKWTVILNSEWNQWGAYNYDESKDVLRVELDVQENASTEMCTYLFDRVSKTSGILSLQWQTTRIDIPIETNTQQQTLDNIQATTDQIRESWYTFSAAAQYHFYELKEAEKALEYIEVAIAMDAPNPSPWMLKSQILAFQGKYQQAIDQASLAIEVCKNTNHAFEISENEENIKAWKKEL